MALCHERIVEEKRESITMASNENVAPRSQNTYLVAYSDFSIVFFDLLPVFVLYYMIVLSWIWIRGLGVSPSLNRGPDPRVLLDLDIPVFRFDRFQF